MLNQASRLGIKNSDGDWFVGRDPDNQEDWWSPSPEFAMEFTNMAQAKQAKKELSRSGYSVTIVALREENGDLT